MAKNAIRTSKGVASNAGKLLSKPGNGKTVKSVSGSALNNRKASSK